MVLWTLQPAFGVTHSTTNFKGGKGSNPCSNYGYCILRLRRGERSGGPTIAWPGLQDDAAPHGQVRTACMHLVQASCCCFLRFLALTWIVLGTTKFVFDSFFVINQSETSSFF